jgi:tetratricopeptide (TPR) repeat protein
MRIQSTEQLFLRQASTLIVGILALLITACAPESNQSNSNTTAQAKNTAYFVGSGQCISCHAAEHKAWQSSQHQLAMQHVSRSAVLAPFAGESLKHHGNITTFSTCNNQFIIHTEGPDGKPADFPVKYVFGLSPLQQYLIELPGGRLQAFTLAWDTRPKNSGGQHWFDLYPNETYKAGDPLHWTGYQQNWNYMCADCHSTNLRKNYDAASNSFNTTWSEISVGCEACHGPASQHLMWAQQGQSKSQPNKGLTHLLDERNNVTWMRNASTDQPQRSIPRSTSKELDTCARCHSRRLQLTDNVTAATPFAQGFHLALLDQGLYYPDGQMRDEVYNHGSFLQSRMHAAGVTCSDCHDPHTQQLRAPGDAVCAQCHNPKRYTTENHHFHPQQSEGARCASCHMPTHTYMGVDQRHDHSLRIPQPAASAKIGAPDTCTSCHNTRDAQWAQGIINQHYPQPKASYQTHGPAFAALERGEVDASAQVTAIAQDHSLPAIIRASALRRLSQAGIAIDPKLLTNAAKDADPLVRGAAAEAAIGNAKVLQPMLTDSMLSVRLLASQARRQELDSWTKANNEYIAVQRYNADRPEARANLGSALLAQQDIQSAQAALKSAIELDPGFSLAYLNLADSYRAVGDEAKAEQTLKDALRHGRNDIGAIQFALGLSFVRQGKYEQALAALAEANRREPDNVQFTYTYAIALHDRGQKQAALSLLDKAVKRRPNETQLTDLQQIYSSTP